MSTEYENSQKLNALTEAFEELYTGDEDTDVTYNGTTKPSFDKRFKQIVDDYGNIVTLTAQAEAAALSAQNSANISLAANNTYSTVGYGEAGTVDGDVFLVVTADPNIYNVYDNVSGSGSLRGQLSIASQSALDIALINSTNKAKLNLLPSRFLSGDILSPPVTTRTTLPTTLEWEYYNGLLCLHCDTSNDTDTVTIILPVAAFAGGVVSAGVTVQYADAAGGSSNKISVIQYDSSFSQLSLDSTNISNSEIASATRYSIDNITISGSAAYIAFELTHDEREAWYSDFVFCSDSNSATRPASPVSIIDYLSSPKSATSDNLFPDPFFADISDNWTLGSGAVLTAVEVDGVTGLKVTGSGSEKAARIDFDVSDFADTDLAYLTFALVADNLHPDSLVASLVQFDSGLSELYRQEIVADQLVIYDSTALVKIEGVSIDPSCARLSAYFYGSDYRPRTYYLPKVASSAVFNFDTDYYLNAEFETAQTESAIFESYTLLPDVTGGASSGGFTCTGLDRIADGIYAGCWLVGNTGRATSDDANPNNPMVVVVTPDFQRVVTYFTLGYTANVQGVAFDPTDNTFWVATHQDGKLRHYELYGNTGNVATEITGDVYDWDAAGHAGYPNGLAYDASNDALWVGSGSTTTARLISCDPLDSPRQLDTLALASDSADQFFLSGDDLYYSQGANGTNGNVLKTNVVSGANNTVYSGLDYSQAVEGLFIDIGLKRLIVLNNGGYHAPDGSEPGLNTANFYSVRV